MKYITTLLIALAMTGCSTITGYKPVMNERAHKTPVSEEKMADDYAYCQKLATQTAGWATETVGDTLAVASGAAAVGAVSGAIITGAVSAGVGAGAGGAIGGIAGLWYGVYEADETYKRAYNSCMTQLGHFVLW